MTLSFSQSAMFAKSMCEKEDKRINALLNAALGTDVILKFTVSEDKGRPPAQRSPGAKISKKEKDKILNDPAVQMLITELNATVTIDEVKEN